MEHSFYVYAHQTNGKIFYIGKGNGRRAWVTTNRNPHWHNTVNKYGYQVDILANDLTEEAAFELEIFLIEEIGLENLCNMTDGGEGISGLIQSDETRAKISAANKGKTPSAEARAKMSAAKKGRTSHNKGKKHSAEAKAKISAALKAYKLKKQTP